MQHDFPDLEWRQLDGWLQSAQTILWIGSALMLFVAVQSIWPLILGHVDFDLLITTQGRASELGPIAIWIYVSPLGGGLFYLIGNALMKLVQAFSICDMNNPVVKMVRDLPSSMPDGRLLSGRQ